MTNAAWAGPSGLPTRHAIFAALHVASLIDDTGSLVVDARESYWRRAAGGRFGPPDFRLGEQLLIDCGLVERRGERLLLLPELVMLLDADVDDAVTAVCARVADIASLSEQAILDSSVSDVVPDPARREELLVALGRRFDDTKRREVGALGELIALAALREQLSDLGYPQLARAVRHVSLETDQAGYDISAPRIGGGTRLIEVKASTALSDDTISFYLSRNEHEMGLQLRDWYLLVCDITSLERREGAVAGWCSSSVLATHMPIDGDSARWETASVTLPRSDLVIGLPSPN